MNKPDPVVSGNPRTGPLIALWNQRGWIEPNHPELLPETINFGRRNSRRRCLRLKPFFFLVRVQPPKEKDLAEFGREVAELFKLPDTQPDPQEGDRAVFLAGGQWARDAAHALGRSTTHLARIMADVEVVSLAIKVWSAS
jgi:hypothetical protein